MRYLLLLLWASLFVGCSPTTSLFYQKDTISLQVSGRAIDFSGKTIHSAQQNLGKISVRQYLFRDTYNETLVYEYARLQMGYTFKYNYQYVLGHVFDAEQVQQIKNENGLGFFTIELKDGHSLNAIIKTGTKRSLTMLYGFSTENFKALMDESALTIQTLKEVKEEEAVKSQWSAKLIIFGTLLEQEGGKASKRTPIK